jgi:uncharacterized membrane protein YqiK
MGYRDDDNAQRLRAEQLEAELGDARRELAQLRGRAGGEGAAAAPDASEPPDDRRPARVIAPGVALIVLGLAVAMVAPLLPLPAFLPLAMAVGAALACVGLLLMALASLLHVARPCEALVIAGRTNRLPDGTVSNLFVQVGGRAIRRPFIESVSMMSLRVMPVEMKASRAICHDGASAELEAMALVKVASEPTRLRHAVERFLLQSPETIVVVARETLEGVLRNHLSELTLDELEGERLMVAERVAAQAEDDFERLGLELVGFWLTAVGDAERRLEQRRRKALAEALRAAELGERAR